MILLIVNSAVHTLGCLVAFASNISFGRVSIRGLLLDQYAMADVPLASVSFVQHAILLGAENTDVLLPKSDRGNTYPVMGVAVWLGKMSSARSSHPNAGTGMLLHSKRLRKAGVLMVIFADGERASSPKYFTPEEEPLEALKLMRGKTNSFFVQLGGGLPSMTSSSAVESQSAWETPTTPSLR